MRTERDAFLRKLVDMPMTNGGFQEGDLQGAGDIVEIFPSFSGDNAIRVEFFGDDIDGLYEL